MASIIILLLASLTGHIAICTRLYNRLHASSIPSRIVHKMEKFLVLAMLTSLVIFAFVASAEYLAQSPSPTTRWVARTWNVVCCAMLSYVIAAWVVRRVTNQQGGLLLEERTEKLDMIAELGFSPIGDRRTRWQHRIPGNQILNVHLEYKKVLIPNLPQQLEGLRVAQLTDLHMTGQLQRPFFDAAVDQINQWDADIVAITGDLVDKAECIDWIPGTLGRLNSRYGVFGLLGNHDQRLLGHVDRLRQALADGGITDVGGRCAIHKIRDTQVLVAGNECPWFPPAPTILAADRSDTSFAILLSHSPDPIPWARRNEFNLMLVGHTHGGQIRFPVVGPVVCPSRYGVRFASGLYYHDPVVMYVSRGLSGVHTLRFNCPPELTLLELARDRDASPHG